MFSTSNDLKNASMKESSVSVDGLNERGDH
jgi:hypothetical protein